MEKRIFNPAELPKPNGAYSYGVLVGRTMYLAGQMGLDKNANVVSSDFEEQTRQTLENLRTVLASVGASLDNVVKTTVFLTDMADFPVMNRIYGEYFPVNPPARSTVQIGPLAKPGARIEIEAIAELD